MRSLIFAGVSMIAMLGAAPASAQHARSLPGFSGGRMAQPQMGQPMPQPMPMPGQPMQPMQPGHSMPRQGHYQPGYDHSGHYRPGYDQPGHYQPGYRRSDDRQSRWGNRIGGHWYGGVNAPGGWNAYRRPYRGWTLPSYWISPGFYVNDFGAYGLSTPPYGYSWSRYYDDAVLIDQRGRVWDSMSGIDWDRDEGGYGQGGYDRGGDDETGYGAPYPAPEPRYAPPHEVVQGYAPGTTTVTQGYASGGYYYPPAATTTVTLRTAPAITTTTTEYIEEVVSHSPRRAWRAPKHKWRPPVRRQCGCGCGCR